MLSGCDSRLMSRGRGRKDDAVLFWRRNAHWTRDRPVVSRSTRPVGREGSGRRRRQSAAGELVELGLERIEQLVEALLERRHTLALEGVADVVDVDADHRQLLPGEE